jgi:gamma-glutamyltranspeptidase / glutathione hydrolase
VGAPHNTGVVAAGDPQTAEAGAHMLRAGGSAVDAVCGAAFAAFVTEAPLCSPAGGGALLYGGGHDGLHLLDFFAAVPGIGLPHVPPEDFFSVDVDFGPTVQQFHIGRGSVAVPGALLGLLAAHRRAGRLPLREVIAPAVALARRGAVLSPQVRYIVSILEPIVRLTPATAAMFGATEAIPPAGTVICNAAIADLFEAVAEDGEAFVRADLHRDLLSEFGTDSGGRLTAADLEAYQPVEREPLGVTLGAHRILTNPPPSSGGALVGLGLHLARTLDPALLDGCGPRHVSEVAALLGALSHARSRGYDALVHGPDAVARLFAPPYRTDVEAAHARLRAESPLGSTTHISVLDARGDAASLTMSNGEGCGHTLARWGVHVNNFLGEDDINPNGFHRQRAGARMTTMMAPTVVLRDGEPILVLGSGGSNRIRSALLQVLLGTLLADRPIARSIPAPRLHVEGSKLWFESTGLSDAAVSALREGWVGATEFTELNMFFGGVHAVARERGVLNAVGDSRRGGAVAIVR